MLSKNRIARLRDYCLQKNLDGFYVRDTANIAWLSAVEGVFDEESAHALLINEKGVCLHTDSRYSAALRGALAKVSSKNIEPGEVQGANEVSSELFKQTASSLHKNALGYCSQNDIQLSDEPLSHARFAQSFFSQDVDAVFGIEDSMSLREWVDLKKLFSRDRMSITRDVVKELRSVKDAEEISRMKRAQAVTDAGFSHIITFIKPGMTEEQVARELEAFLMSHGADALSFQTIVATGPHGALPHAVPGKTVLNEGDCVVMDFGVKVDGYCSDMTRTVFLGQPCEKMCQAYAALRKANEAVEEALRTGVTGAQMYELAESILADCGFGGKMGHGLGHGVGLEIHEEPVLNPRYKKELKLGQVVTVEPGIYLEGEFGMRLEDFGVITEEGFEVFTQSPHEMVIIGNSSN